MAATSDYEHIDLRLDDGIATLRLGPTADLPAHPMHRELRDAVVAATSDPAVRALVVGGRDGEFLTGPSLGHVRHLYEDPAVVRRLMDEVRDVLDALLGFERPFVAAVDGPAYGLGAHMAFLADIVLAGPDAEFRDSHVRFGLAAGDGGAWLWPLVVGPRRARRHVLLGHPLFAAEAKALGVVDDLVAADELLAVATARASRMAELPEYAFAATKAALLHPFRAARLAVGEAAHAAELASGLLPEFRAAIDRLVRPTD